MRACVIDETREMPHFRSEDRPSVGRQPIVTALGHLTVLGIAGGRGFLDVPGVLESLDGLIEGAGTEPDLTAGTLLHLLLDGVAVSRAISKRQQNVDDRQRQRSSKLGSRARRHNMSLDDMYGPRVCSLKNRTSKSVLQ